LRWTAGRVSKLSHAGTIASDLAPVLSMIFSLRQERVFVSCAGANANADLVDGRDALVLAGESLSFIEAHALCLHHRSRGREDPQAGALENGDHDQSEHQKVLLCSGHGSFFPTTILR
jgi:hypothetical protein